MFIASGFFNGVDHQGGLVNGQNPYRRRLTWQAFLLTILQHPT
jgi:hypothetical protein